ncbi:MAG: hypothetical protein ACRDG4_08980, partial [Chloroflexota bacterium]
IVGFVQTDIPLKELTVACAPDLLPLLGSEDATILGVESLELPAMATRLDTLLRLISPRGTPYLHLVEWQGYRDPGLLKRITHYRSWLVMHQPLPVAATVVYLKREDDMGAVLQQTVDGKDVYVASVSTVRLWNLHADEAVASGRTGLAVLSPLMRGADRALVEEAAAVILRNERNSAQQTSLIGILGVFAEGLMEPVQLERILGRERLMESKLVDYLARDKIAEVERRANEREKQLTERELNHMYQAISMVISSRFPTMPFAVGQATQSVTDPDRLLQLHNALLTATDQAAAETAIRAVVEAEA